MTITWGPTGPFELQTWGGWKKLPRNDPRVANDPRWRNIEIAVDPTSPGGDSLPDLPRGASQDPTEGMDIDMSGRGSGAGSGSRGPPGDGDVEMAAASSSNDSGSKVSKETPILQGQSPSYGLQETHTTICPFDGWFSVINPSITFATPIVAEFRLTSPLDPFTKNLSNTVQAAAWTAGLNNVPWNGALTRSTTAQGPAEFPILTPAGASATDKAGWFAYWAKIYEYYTVLSCEYHIKIHNPSELGSNDLLMGFDFNTYSDTATATGNKTPQDATLTEMQAFKHIQWKNIRSSYQNGDNGLTSIRGTYYPGMAARNISNDGDVKTWSLTTAQPSFKEFLTLYFYRAPLNYQNNDYASGGKATGCNVQYTMKYIIQFKDLRVQARYPTAAGTDISQTIDTDTIQVA